MPLPLLIKPCGYCANTVVRSVLYASSIHAMREISYASYQIVLLRVIMRISGLIMTGSGAGVFMIGIMIDKDPELLGRFWCIVESGGWTTGYNCMVFG